MNNRGFIALTSVLILSAVLVALVASAGIRSFYARFDALEREYKAESEALARSCIEIARMRFIADSDYAGDELIPIGDEECTISNVANHEFTVSASYRNAETWYQIKVDADGTLTLEEIPSSGK